MSSASPHGANHSAASDDTVAGTASPSSQPWTEANSAAGFVIRYLMPMRDQLIHWLGEESLADECLKLLIAHLVSQGFGTNAKGRMRDFLIRGIRSAAKAVIAEVPEQQRVVIDFTSWTPDANSWLQRWRATILARTWRALERMEHSDISKPLFTILRSASAYPRETAEMLAIRIRTEGELSVNAATIKRLLPVARKRFVQILLAEIGDTLDRTDAASIQAELQAIGLADAVSKLRSG